jgi:hypothetical protein
MLTLRSYAYMPLLVLFEKEPPFPDHQEVGFNPETANTALLIPCVSLTMPKTAVFIAYCSHIRSVQVCSDNWTNACSSTQDIPSIQHLCHSKWQQPYASRQYRGGLPAARRESCLESSRKQDRSAIRRMLRCESIYQRPAH